MFGLLVTVSLMINLVDDVRDGLKAVLTGAGDVVSVVTDTAKESVIKIVHGAGEVTVTGINAVSTVVQGGVEAIAESGGSLKDGVVGLVRGTVGGAKDVGVDSVEAAGEAGSVAIKTASDLGSDLGEVAVSSVEGAVAAAGDLGEDATDVGKGAVIGVLRAADEIGSEAGGVVRKALLHTAALPHDVIEALVSGKTS